LLCFVVSTTGVPAVAAADVVLAAAEVVLAPADP
jgi:hypothetical protein